MYKHPTTLRTLISKYGANIRVKPNLTVSDKFDVEVLGETEDKSGYVMEFRNGDVLDIDKDCEMMDEYYQLAEISYCEEESPFLNEEGN